MKEFIATGTVHVVVRASNHEEASKKIRRIQDRLNSRLDLSIALGEHANEPGRLSLSSKELHL